MHINLKFLNILGGVLACLFSSQGYLHSVWQPPVIISNPAIPQTSNPASPVLSVNPQGNAVAVWEDSFSTVYPFPGPTAISSSFYTRGVGWSAPQVISSLALIDLEDGPLFIEQRDPDVALNSSNFAVAVWEGLLNLNPYFSSIVLATTRDPNTGMWTPVTILSDPSGDVEDNLVARNINVSLNEAGTALAAWQYQRNDGNFYTAVRFLRGGVWTPEFSFPTYPGNFGVGKPYPDINPSGNAVVSWQGRLSNGLATVTVATYNTAINSWSPQVILDSGNINTFSSTPRSTMDPNGNAAAIWINNGDVNTSYFNGSSWGPTFTIGTTAGGISFSNDGPEIIMDSMGNVTATWTSSQFTIESAFRLPNGSWSPAQTISAPGTFGKFDPNLSHETLAVNPAGDLTAIWAVTDASGDNLSAIVSAFKPFGKAWQTPEIILNSTDFDFETLNIGLANCGFAVSEWETALLQTIHMFVMAAVNEQTTLPLNTMATRCCDTFVTQKICSNILSWSADPCASFYNIYRGGFLIASIPNTGGALTFTDPFGCQKNNGAIYTISAVNHDGFEGTQVPFTFL